MKRIVLLSFVVISVFWVHLLAAGQDAPVVCEFNMVGTWRLTTEGHANPTLLRFESNGRVKVLSPNTSGDGPEWQSTDWYRYKLDDPKAPKSIRLSPINKDERDLEPGKVTTIDITKFDDGVFTSAVSSNAGVELTQWTRLDPYRYFVVLAAAKATPGYGGPAFAMLIKTDERETQTEAFGLYETDPIHHYVEVGVISEEIRNKFESEPQDDSAAMLRLEVAAGPYQRAMKIMKTWERRARENTLLYPDIPYLNNAVYLNQLAGSLNDCGDTIHFAKLTWRIDDPIITRRNLPQVPYYFIKELRQLNQGLHVKDVVFHDHSQRASLPLTR